MELSQLFGTEKISRILRKLAPPVMLAQLIQALYNIVDSLFVGKYGDSGLTALSIIYPMQLLMIALAVGTGVGINTVMAARLGVGREEDARRYAGLSTPVGLVLWVLFAVVSWFVMPCYARMSTSSPEVIRDVVVYGRIVCTASIGLFLESVWTKVHQANGDMKTPTVAQIAGAITNIVLDPLLIFGLWGLPRLGIAGAAIATVAAQLISTVACFIYAFAKYPQLRLHREDMRITRGDIRRHVVQGVPLGLQFSVLAIGIIVMQGVVVQFDMLDGVMVSSSAQMGFGAANKLSSLTATPMNALGTAMTSFTAQNLGAGNHDRIRRGALQALGMMAIIAVAAVSCGLLLTLNNTYLHIFLSADKITADTIRFGNTFLYVDYSMYLFLGCVFIIRNCVQGIGRSQFVLGAGAAELVARIAVCLVLPAAVAGGAVSAAASPAAFYALCAADPLAWIAADIIMGIPVVRNILRKDYRYMNL